MIINEQATGFIQTMETLPKLNLKIREQYANMATLGQEEGKQLSF